MTQPLPNRNGAPRVLLTFAVIYISLLLPFLTTAQPAARQPLPPRHLPPPALALRPLDRLPTTNRLNLAIGLPLRNQAALHSLLQQLYDPVSTNYHHYLTPEQFTERFGPTEQDYRTVRNFARANGLKVTTEHPNRLLLEVNGTVADIERVFHTTLRV